MWDLDHKEGRTVMLEKTLKSHLDCKEIKPVNCKGNQPWILIGRIDAKAEAPILCPPDAKSWLIGKGPDAGKDWGQEKEGVIEDEMVGWHHRFNGHELGPPGDDEGQGRLECCSPWAQQVSDTTSDWITATARSKVQVQCSENKIIRKYTF